LEQEVDVFIGRLMVSWSAIRHALTPGRDEHSTDRIALLHAVTDWERARMPRPLTDDVLAPLFIAYRNTLTTARPRHPAAGLPDALAWATTRSAGKEQNRPALITQCRRTPWSAEVSTAGCAEVVVGLGGLAGQKQRRLSVGAQHGVHDHVAAFLTYLLPVAEQALALESDGLRRPRRRGIPWLDIQLEAGNP
jgi:hypothetical protein